MLSSQTVSQPGKLLDTVVNGVKNDWAEAAKSFLESLNIQKDEPTWLAWELISKALLQALKSIIETNYRILETEPENVKTLKKSIEKTLAQVKLTLTEDLFTRPKDLEVLEIVKEAFAAWGQKYSLTPGEAEAMASRLDSYFVLALYDEWADKSDHYEPLQEHLKKNPFKDARKQELNWQRYQLSLVKQADEPMFDEAFSLRRVYIPLRAYYEQKRKDKKKDASDELLQTGGERPDRHDDIERVVVDLNDCLQTWLKQADKDDAIRVISGGPGSGKSSFTKMLAAVLAESGKLSVLYVPLHNFELRQDLLEAISDYTSYDPYLKGYNPLLPENKQNDLLVIFDGLDELSMQGKANAEAVELFIDEIHRRVSLLNKDKRVKILLSGRTLVVQDQEAKALRKVGQVLHLLPYHLSEENQKIYSDTKKLLKVDQRQEWWKKYGVASGNKYQGLPKPLERSDEHQLTEITAQPLLNYLVALSYQRGQVNFTDDTNLNEIYADLLAAVFERGYEKGRNPIAKEINYENFTKMLEVIGLTAWHGGEGRTTTVAAIMANTPTDWFEKVFASFAKSADKGVTRLLTAFYFRQAGETQQGDKTFEFTHKSFGEYLTARCIVAELSYIHEQLEKSKGAFRVEWNEKRALKRWAEVCGPSRMDEYLLDFLRREVKLQDEAKVAAWQRTLCHLIALPRFIETMIE
jgi:hypothetical protein